LFPYFQPSFQNHVLLKSDFKGSGHFGTSLGKIGDINGDGFNDLAVSAPFENRGVVYVYLGGSEGISEKPIQKVIAPESLNLVRNRGSPMFGFSISGRSDIDSNGYPDIAIGSPNSEQVFVYKSYPIVHVEARLATSITPLPVDEGKIGLKVCARLNSTRKFSGDVGELVNEAK
jgi:hypothetical protein